MDAKVIAMIEIVNSVLARINNAVWALHFVKGCAIFH
jgi:hypothetical protein